MSHTLIRMLIHHTHRTLSKVILKADLDPCMLNIICSHLHRYSNRRHWGPPQQPGLSVCIRKSSRSSCVDFLTRTRTQGPSCVCGWSPRATWPSGGGPHDWPAPYRPAASQGQSLTKQISREFYNFIHSCVSIQILYNGKVHNKHLRLGVQWMLRN